MPHECGSIGPGVDLPVAPGRTFIEKETVRSPKFMENPIVPAPCSWTPARPTYQVTTVGRRGPTYIQPRRLSTSRNFGARSHGIGTRCLRFAVRLTPPHARLASGCLPGSTRRDWLPAGFLRKVSVMFHIAFPFPTLLGAVNVPWRNRGPAEPRHPP